jgi:hypothetical protein
MKKPGGPQLVSAPTKTFRAMRTRLFAVEGPIAVRMADELSEPTPAWLKC